MDNPAEYEVRVLVVEDESLVAHDIKEILEDEGYEVFLALSPGKAMQQIEAVKPDLVILDINLEAELSGVDIAEWLDQKFPEAPYFFLTAYSDKKTLDQVKTTNPRSFIAKPFHQAQLISTVSLVLSRQNERNGKPISLSQEKNTDRFNIFSTRENEIARYAALGWPNKRIAQEVFVSVNTVKYHLKNIYEKLGVHSRAELWHLVFGKEMS